MSIPKYNAQEFDSMFRGFIQDVDRVIAMNKAQVSCGVDGPPVDGSRSHSSAEQDGCTAAGIQIAYDEGGSEVGHVSDWRDAEGITDAPAEMEMWRNG